ncbi:hypothetical protein Tco_0743137 [Tanacetum coccineum]
MLVFTAEKRGQREDGLMDDIHLFSNRTNEHIPASSSRIRRAAAESDEQLRIFRRAVEPILASSSRFRRAVEHIYL